MRVDAEARGWEVGVKAVRMGKEFRDEFGRLGVEVPEEMRLQFVHGDCVVVPGESVLPEGWVVLGSTEWCANQGMMEVGRVLTYQGHFEFDRFVNGETIKTFFAREAPEWLEESLRAVDADDDAGLAAELVVHFAVQKSTGGVNETYKQAGGLVTPPDEEV